VGISLSLVGLAIIAYLTQCGIKLVVLCAATEIKSRAYHDVDESSPSSHGASAWTLVSTAAFGAPGRIVTLLALLTAQAAFELGFLRLVDLLLLCSPLTPVAFDWLVIVETSGCSRLVS
ncbi:MAG: hypothetical protein SGPRY_014732, partial [Prymnesium sp.]